VRSYAILLDGGFLKRKLGSPADPATPERVKQFTDRLVLHPVLRDLTLHRVYYYDALPFTESRSIPLSRDQAHFGSTDVAVRNKKLIQAVTRFPFYATRLGETVFRGWGIRSERLREKSDAITITKADIQPLIGQKGVDMRIGLDVASLTLKHIVQIIVLVTGDSDFVPVMKFARREGAQLYLVTLGHGIRDNLEDHADLMLKLEDCPEQPASAG